MNLPVSIWTNEDCVAFWAEERPAAAKGDAWGLGLEEGGRRGIKKKEMLLEVITRQPVLLRRINVLVRRLKHSVYRIVIQFYLHKFQLVVGVVVGINSFRNLSGFRIGFPKHFK